MVNLAWKSGYLHLADFYGKSTREVWFLLDKDKPLPYLTTKNWWVFSSNVWKRKWWFDFHGVSKYARHGSVLGICNVTFSHLAVTAQREPDADMCHRPLTKIIDVLVPGTLGLYPRIPFKTRVASNGRWAVHGGVGWLAIRPMSQGTESILSNRKKSDCFFCWYPSEVFQKYSTLAGWLYLHN